MLWITFPKNSLFPVHSVFFYTQGICLTCTGGGGCRWLIWYEVCLWTEHLKHTLINWKKFCTSRQCATLGIKRHKTWQSFTVRFLLFLHFWQSRGIFAPMWSRSRNNPEKEIQIKHLDSILWIIQMYFRCTCAKYLNYLVFLLYLLHSSEKIYVKKRWI